MSSEMYNGLIKTVLLLSKTSSSESRPALGPIAPRSKRMGLVKPASGCISLNFKRNKFFPYIHDELKGNGIFFNSSLGLISSLNQQGRTSKKSKATYLATSRLIRRIVVHSNHREYNLKLRGSPKYLSEIVSVMYSKPTVTYANPSDTSSPFDESLLDHAGAISPKSLRLSLSFRYRRQKLKGKGRLKRKVSKRLIASNRVID